MTKINSDLRRLAKLALMLAAVVIVLAGCEAVQENGDAPAEKKDAVAPDAEPLEKGEVRIIIENFVFAPAEVTVTPGTKVTWINKDEAPHTATSVGQKFNSGGLDTGDKYSFIFNDKGDYEYICTLHPQMKAIVKVR